MSHGLFAVLFDDSSSGRVQKKKFRAVIMICSIVHHIRGTDSGLSIHRSARESSKNRQQTYRGREEIIASDYRTRDASGIKYNRVLGRGELLE
jgi:hypothetical protein